MTKQVVDLDRVKKALSALDRIAAEHPELCNPDGPRWADNLDELDRLTMGTPVKQRIRNYRARLRAKGYRAATVYLTADGHDRLLRLSAQTGLTYGDLISQALAQYENSQAIEEHNHA